MNKLVNANSFFLNGEYEKAFELYLRLVSENLNAVAACNVGYMYQRGIGVVRNYKKALAYYEAASELDGGISFFNMALMYMRGQGVEVDICYATDLMRLSAEHGCPDASLYLGLAYIMGYAYDPVEIECATLIPYYRVIYRDPSSVLLGGAGYDPDIENSRYAAIEADADEAVELYCRISREHKDDPTAENQLAAAEFMIGKAYIEGLGNRYDPRLGFNRIYDTAIRHHSQEAAQYILANSERANAFCIEVEQIAALASQNYFRPTMGNLGTPQSHRILPLLPDNEDN